MIASIDIITITSVFLFLYAAWSDFRLWKIPNGTVLALIVVYALDATLRLMTAKQAGGALGLLTEEDLGATLFSLNGIGGDLAAGLLLFALGFALWCFRLFGAGDAKLFLPIGLFIGWYAMLPFAMFLLIGGVLTMLALKLPLPLQFAHYAVVIRLEEIRTTRKIPYGVIMVGAALAVMALRPAGA
ncbi:prepilin peptidase CpaA [Sinorhizobium kostiense]|uniref:Prepilin peptidase CpaA n=1 Tax=Sinorhizobium kostiense TaxID=76747 RepID=A0ABS4R6P4_9HYPH|nr:prepilin peptidase [Sinorhizobium kostiense]MBP2237512.1 prepilin peptidase CpaA [Sinorhizobium kostiense]